ncbi:phosphoglycerate mutase-like protein [Rickenella mellea]|uniref:Phosphoglycerate mutase-like protein n=1 Tax=Rickenella mellea TaxID=50990 RepID=A0A4Y7Q7Z2_9AGAM|nr:phosphoglycerate mutase-like protein [Rickenella mellea]
MHRTSVTGLPGDPHLNTLGETQSQELANYFKELPISERPTAIFSSPLYRCLQTIRPTAQVLGLPIFIEHGLAEWYSTVKTDGSLHPSFPLATDVFPFIPEIDPSWTSVVVPDRKGETEKDLHDRCEKLSTALHTKMDSELQSENHSHILMVGHVAPLIALIRVLLGDRSKHMSLGCTSVTELRKAEAGGWDTISLGSGEHLKRGALFDWGFHDMYGPIRHRMPED